MPREGPSTRTAVAVVGTALAVTVIAIAASAPVGEASNDCELVRSGGIAQPSGAWSALSICLVALWGLHRTPRRGASIIATTMLLAGVAAFSSHATLHPLAMALDTSAVSALGAAIAATVAGPLDSRVAAVGAAMLGLVPVLGAAIAFASVLTAAVLVVRLGSMGWLALLTFSIGVIVWILSRTGRPWCDPDSIVQGHAVWHVLAALGLGLVLHAIGQHNAGDLRRST